MSEIATGSEVIKQAADNSIMNTNPALATGAVVGVVGALASIAVIGGYIDQAAADELKKQAGVIVPAMFIIAGIIQGVWTRMNAWSGKSAAHTAVVNARSPEGSPPVLVAAK